MHELLKTTRHKITRLFPHFYYTSRNSPRGLHEHLFYINFHCILLDVTCPLCVDTEEESKCLIPHLFTFSPKVKAKMNMVNMIFNRKCKKLH